MPFHHGTCHFQLQHCISIVFHLSQAKCKAHNFCIIFARLPQSQTPQDVSILNNRCKKLLFKRKKNISQSNSIYITISHFHRGVATSSQKPKLWSPGTRREHARDRPILPPTCPPIFDSFRAKLLPLQRETGEP